MLATGQFYLCWLLYAIGAGAGLMIISQLATTVAKQANLLESGFWLVMACGVGNGAGRILAGMLSDKLGRQRTLQGCFLFQAAVLMVLSVALPNTLAGSLPVMLLLSALVGANYGANLAIFPSITKDYYGLKNFGVNYGLVFTAWGFGGFMLAQAASKIYDKLGVFTYNYYGAASLLVVAVIVTFALKPPHISHEPAAEPISAIRRRFGQQPPGTLSRFDDCVPAARQLSYRLSDAPPATAVAGRLCMKKQLRQQQTKRPGTAVRGGGRTWGRRMAAWNNWYHVNGNTYGTWLPGDPRGWRERGHKKHVDGDYKSPPPAGSGDAMHRYAHDF